MRKGRTSKLGSPFPFVLTRGKKGEEKRHAVLVQHFIDADEKVNVNLVMGEKGGKL